jgi:hypothetical protein
MDTSTRKRQLRALRFALAVVLMAFATMATTNDALGLVRGSGAARVDSALFSQTVQLHNTTTEDCNPDEWHFLLTNIDDGEEAPAFITITFLNAGEVQIPLTSVTPGGLAHYFWTANLDDTVVGGEAVVYDGWDGNFNLSHGPCNEPQTPTNTPTVVVPTDTPTVVVPTDTPTVIVPTDTPTTPAETPTTPAETPTTPAETPTTPAETPTNTATTTVVTEVPSETATVGGATEVPSPTASVEETVAGVSNVPDSGIGTAFGGSGGGLASIMIMLALAMAAGLFGWKLRPADIRR